MPLNIWWIRRDLRLHDNQALHAALRLGRDVVPLFILDPKLLRSAYVGEARLAFLLGGLRELDKALRQRGSRLVVRTGDPLDVLVTLRQELDVAGIYAEADITPYSRRRDTAVQAQLPLHLTDGLGILKIGSVLKTNNTPYTVYTPFNKRWLSTCTLSSDQIIDTPRAISTPQDIPSAAIPDAPTLPPTIPFPPGEDEALRRFQHFIQHDPVPLNDYAQFRDRPDVEGTSQLSPYLRFGMISIRRLALAAQVAIAAAPTEAAREGAQSWLNELLWREFYQSILFHFPHVRTASYFPNYDAISWRNDETHFAAWCAGRTGYPIVDAAMRQLATTGWMHNRTRMIVASFLVKDLLIDWRWGEKWFMQKLVDGDPASNNGGWQWTAGCGPNAATYFRVYNPITQGSKFDPDGIYIRRWVPELAAVPTPHIQSPWLMSPSEQIRARCTIGRDYPHPIVDHETARDLAIATYKAALAG